MADAFLASRWTTAGQVSSASLFHLTGTRPVPSIQLFFLFFFFFLFLLWSYLKGVLTWLNTEKFQINPEVYDSLLSSSALDIFTAS